MNFTIITPTRASSSISSTSTTTLMDQAAHQKEQKSKLICKAAGWNFQPFVADTYGAMRQDARDFISRLIRKCSHKFAPMDAAEAGRAIWSTVSTAIISRAVQQLCCLASSDSPFGLPLQHLNMRTARTTSSSISIAASPYDIGNNNPQQPSQDARRRISL